MPTNTIFDDVAADQDKDAGTTIFDQVAAAPVSREQLAVDADAATKLGFQGAKLPAARGTLDLGAPPPKAPDPATQLVNEQRERAAAKLPVGPVSPGAGASPADVQRMEPTPVNLSGAAQPEDVDQLEEDQKPQIVPISGGPFPTFATGRDTDESRAMADAMNKGIQEAAGRATGAAGVPRIYSGGLRAAKGYVTGDPTEELSGAAEATGGALEASTIPMIMGGVGALKSLPAALTMARDLTAIYGAQKAARIAGKKFGLSDDATELLANTIALAAPLAAARTLGRGDISVEDPASGIKAEQATVGPLAVAQASSPAGTRIGVKVGPFRAEHVFGSPEAAPVKAPTLLDDPDLMTYGQTPSGGRPMPPSPPDIANAPPSPASPDMVSDSVRAISEANVNDARTARAAKGLPPDPPPAAPPPMPEVTPQTVQKIGDQIEGLPQEQRAPAMIKAHEELATALLHQGRVVGPDGKLEVIDSPKKAATVAQQFINNEVDRRDEAADAQAKAAAKAKPTAAPANADSVSAVRAARRQPFEVVGEEEPQVESAHGTSTDTGEGASNVATYEAPNGTGTGADIYGRTGSGSLEHDEAGSGESGRPAESEPVHEVLREEEAPPAKLKKNDTVTLADGRSATVEYASPTMNFLRVRTRDGENVSVRGQREISSLKPSAANVHEHASTQINLPPKQAKTVLDAGRKLIAEEDLAPQGREGEPHITAKFGVHEDEEGLRGALAHHEPFTAKLGKVHVFPPGKHSEGAAPVVAEVHAPELHKMHEGISQAIGAKEDDFDYQPHVTLGYVKPEAAAKYEGSTALEGTEIPVEHVTLSRKDRTQKSFPLGAKAASGGHPLRGQVGEMRVSDLKTAPNKFQYKLGTDVEGVSSLLKEQRRYNPDLAGTISVWRDPQSGQFYVVNGHHRYDLAKRTGQKTVAVRHIVARDATEARSIGALQNIAEGRGTPIDAAKFIRDTGMTPEELSEEGISMGEATAARGVALSKLDSLIFNKVVAGDLSVGRAVAIGEATADPAEQKAILELVQKKERLHHKISDDVLRELIRFVKSSGKAEESQVDLFGSQTITRSHALEKAEISAYVKQTLAKDRKLFGVVSKQGHAERLAAGGNKIDVDRSRDISTGAAQAEEVYNKLSERGGPISDILDQAAQHLAEGKNAAAVKSDAYERIRAEVSKTLSGSAPTSPAGREGAPDARSKAEALYSDESVPEQFKPVAKNLDELEQKYDALGTPNYIAADKVKELAPGWERKDNRPGLSESVHPDSATIATQLFERKLDRLSPGDKVHIVTGPVAAGKTTAITGAKKEAALTYEINLASLKKASTIIDQIIAHGAEPTISYVYNTPEGSVVRRASRAQQDGRTVRINLSSSQHLELPDTIEKLHQKYGDKLPIDIVDNSGNQPKTVPIESVGQLKYNGTREDLLNEQQRHLDRLRDEGTISADLHAKLSNSEGISEGTDREHDGKPARGGKESGKLYAADHAPIFYSKAERVAEQKLPPSGTGSQILSTLRNGGVKEDEIKWLGLDDFLKNRLRVSKTDVQKFIRENQVQVRDVARGRTLEHQKAIDDASAKVDTADRKFIKIAEREAREKFDHQPQAARELAEAMSHSIRTGNRSSSEVLRSHFDRIVHPELAEAGRDLFNYNQDLREAKKENQTITRFDEYTLPGEKKNYTELLMTLPYRHSEKPTFSVKQGESGHDWHVVNDLGGIVVTGGTREYAEKKASELNLEGLPPHLRGRDGRNFQSNHFDEPNVLAHVRFDDRTDVDGKHVLFVEELQSDWHQKGKKQGYASNLSPEQSRLAAQGIPVQNIKGAGVPDAPFKTTWHELALKRMIRYAAENGYDKIGFTTGEQQAARYDLSKHVDSIDWQKNSDGTYDVSPTKDGQSINGAVRHHISESDIGDLLGKEIAQKIKEGQGQTWSGNGTSQGSLSGLDLKVGGEGMKGFYDKIVPDFLNKYGKKWGAKVGETKLLQSGYANPTTGATVPGVGAPQFERNHPELERNAATVHALSITPEMKKSVLEEGQPLFHQEQPLITGRSPQAESFIANHAKVELVKPGGNVPSYVRANQFAMQLILKANGHGFRGASMSEAAANDVLDELRKMLPQYDEQGQRSVQQLVDTLQKATDPADGLNIIRQGHTPEQELRVIHEELFHSAVQRRAGGGDLSAGIPLKEMIDDPGVRKMRQRIEGEVSHKTDLVVIAEAAADLAVGSYDELTPEEAGRSSWHYYSALADAHGLKPLEAAQGVFDHIDDLATQRGIIQPGEQFNVEHNGPNRRALSRVLASRRGSPNSSGGLQPAANEGNAPSAATGAKPTTGTDRLAGRGENDVSRAPENARPDAGESSVARPDLGRQPNRLGETDARQEATRRIREIRQRANGGELESGAARGGSSPSEISRTGSGSDTTAKDSTSLHSTAPVGLTDDELDNWSKSRGFRYEPAGEQLGMFGGNEPVVRVYRNGPKGEERGLAYQSQIEALSKPKAEEANEPFALTPTDAQQDDQPRLFGPGDMGEIIGNPHAKSGNSDKGDYSLFSREQKKNAAGKDIGNPVREAFEQDVKPALEKSGIRLKDAAAFFVSAVYPRIEESSLVGKALGIGAPREAVDTLMGLKGAQAQKVAEFDGILRGMEKMFDRLPESSRIDFIDRIQTGKEQETPELQQIAKAIDAIQKEQRAEEQTAANLGRPASKAINLPTKENYFNNRWETPPGGGKAEDEDTRVSRLFTPRRPLEGSKSYNKQQTYTLKKGIEAGGKPVTTNPVRLLRLRVEDGMKFVAARHAWDELGRLDLRQYVARGERIPEGFDRIDDRIARVYFPAELASGKTATVEGGQWAVEANTARLLNNMLSRDLIRGNPIGSGIMWLKNASTAIELGLSPFHAVFETLEAASSQLSLGMLRTYNLGIRGMDAHEFTTGLRQMLEAPIAPITMAREGAALPAYIEARARLEKIGVSQFGHKQIEGSQPHGIKESLAHFRQVRKQENIERLLERYPDLDQLIDDMFLGGLTIGQHHDYQVKMLNKTAMEAWTAGNPLGAVVRAVPTILQGVMKPLFQWYIPNLKYSLFMRLMSEQAAEHAADLESGAMTRAQLARKVADSVENRFGEMNFDNLFWNRTFKSAMQIAFRSVTWKLGTTREIGGAVSGQAKELGTWAWQAHRLLGGEGPPKGEPGDDIPFPEPEAEKPGALPRLDMKASWVMSLLMVTVGIGTIASKALSHKWPWEWTAEEAKDKAEGTWDHFKSLYRETIHARTGETDSRGLPVRISPPTYVKEIENASQHPGRWLMGSVSGMLSKSLDLAHNEDYFGNYVYNPNASTGRQLKQAAKYMAPESFAATNIMRGHDEGQTKAAWLGAFGFPKAPADLDFTPAERLAHDILRAKSARLTPEEVEQWKEKRDALKNGEATRKEMRRYEKAQRSTWLQRDFKQLGYADALKVYDRATETEKDDLARLLRQKRRNLREHGRRDEAEAAEANQ